MAYAHLILGVLCGKQRYGFLCLLDGSFCGHITGEEKRVGTGEEVVGREHGWFVVEEIRTQINLTSSLHTS